MEDYRILAETVLVALVPGSGSEEKSLNNAIRLELLVVALHDVERPGTLGELLRVLERISVGEVGSGLLKVTRERAEREPDVLLRELVG